MELVLRMLLCPSAKRKLYIKHSILVWIDISTTVVFVSYVFLLIIMSIVQSDNATTIMLISKIFGIMLFTCQSLQLIRIGDLCRSNRMVKTIIRTIKIRGLSYVPVRE
ncbi:hypothetical protein GJ496_008079 [Pomphorhynchus laevis]|nr:hypothetical protein GJ496_008079 [Pomphorhynchus laevis]